MNDPFHLARQHVRRLANNEPTLAEATHVLRSYCAHYGFDEKRVAEQLADASASSRPTPYDAGLIDAADALRWTDQKPTKPGRYLWRKDRKWEPVEREVVRLKEPAGVLGVWSHRFENFVPLAHLDAGGSQWLIADLRRNEVA